MWAVNSYSYRTTVLLQTGLKFSVLILNRMYRIINIWFITFKSGFEVYLEEVKFHYRFPLSNELDIIEFK